MVINTHSVMGRVAIGKLIGLTLGLIIVVLLPYVGIAPVSMFGFGTVIMFMLMGAMTGLIGQFDRHPLFNFKLSWYLRGPAVGFAFFLMYILLSYDQLDYIMQSSLVSWSGFESPWWILLDGMFYGALMGWVETKISGEGEDLPIH